MTLIYWSGAAAIVAALVVLFGRLTLQAIKNAELKKINADTNGVGDPARSKATLSAYSRRIVLVETVSIVLVAIGVALQTVDTLKERSVEANKPPGPTPEQLVQLVTDSKTIAKTLAEMSEKLESVDKRLGGLTTQIGELEKRVEKLESTKPAKGGGSGGGGGGGGDGGGPAKPGPTSGKSAAKLIQSPEDVERILEVLLKRVSTIEEEMKVRVGSAHIVIPELPA